MFYDVEAGPVLLGDRSGAMGLVKVSGRVLVLRRPQKEGIVQRIESVLPSRFRLAGEALSILREPHSQRAY